MRLVLATSSTFAEPVGFPTIFRWSRAFVYGHRIVRFVLYSLFVLGELGVFDAFGGLTALLAVQILLVPGALWLVSRR